jgi:hypothetical protein
MIEQTPTVEHPSQPQPPAPSLPADATPVAQPTSLANDARRRSPFLAAVLSTMPGLGRPCRALDRSTSATTSWGSFM